MAAAIQPLIQAMIEQRAEEAAENATERARLAAENVVEKAKEAQTAGAPLKLEQPCCSMKGCKAPAYAGGHVKVGGKWWIIPVGMLGAQKHQCQHNKPASNEKFPVCGGTIAVRETRQQAINVGDQILLFFQNM